MVTRARRLNIYGSILKLSTKTFIYFELANIKFTVGQTSQLIPFPKLLTRDRCHQVHIIK